MLIDGKLIIDNADVQKARKSSFGSGTFEGVAAIELEAWSPYKIHDSHDSMLISTGVGRQLPRIRHLLVARHPVGPQLKYVVLDCIGLHGWCVESSFRVIVAAEHVIIDQHKNTSHSTEA